MYIPIKLYYQIHENFHMHSMLSFIVWFNQDFFILNMQFMLKHNNLGSFLM